VGSASLSHLSRRFFEVVRARPLTPRQQAEVTAWLAPPERALFWDQAAADQRHAYEVARRVRARLGEDEVATRAALLHDVGKRHVRMGAVSRTLATVGAVARLPLPASWRRYRDHEALGAADLEAIGADPLVVAFAARVRPDDEAAAARWDALVAADDA
jgi:hypothetical protein